MQAWSRGTYQYLSTVCDSELQPTKSAGSCKVTSYSAELLVKTVYEEHLRSRSRSRFRGLAIAGSTCLHHERETGGRL
ncbi:hypothetical protein SRHO_G00293740 [Serrasalmus rhombeus]